MATIKTNDSKYTLQLSLVAASVSGVLWATCRLPVNDTQASYVILRLLLAPIATSSNQVMFLRCQNKSASCQPKLDLVPHRRRMATGQGDHAYSTGWIRAGVCRTCAVSDEYVHTETNCPRSAPRSCHTVEYVSYVMRYVVTVICRVIRKLDLSVPWLPTPRSIKYPSIYLHRE